MGQKILKEKKKEQDWYSQKGLKNFLKSYLDKALSYPKSYHDILDQP